MACRYDSSGGAMRLDRGTLDTALDTDSLGLFDIVQSLLRSLRPVPTTGRDPLEGIRILFPVARAYGVSQYRGSLLRLH